MQTICLHKRIISQDVLNKIWLKNPSISESSQKWASRALWFNRFWNGKPEALNQVEPVWTAGEKTGVAMAAIVGVPVVASLAVKLAEEYKRYKDSKIIRELSEAKAKADQETYTDLYQSQMDDMNNDKWMNEYEYE